MSLFNRVKIWFFVHGIGNLSRQFYTMDSNAKQWAFLYTHFGKNAGDVMRAKVWFDSGRGLSAN